jgi:cytochrome c553
MAAVVLLALALALVGPDARADEPASYVAGAVCSGCHRAEAERWKDSHHALAMQPATEATVLGDFASAEFEHFGITTTFFRDVAKFMVRTAGPDGALHEYPIAYTFGVYPLQQYLIAFPGGRYQALGIAWDSRQKQDGGQRWFHLYPDRKLPANDRLHWTGSDQTWNYQCADCHSTTTSPPTPMRPAGRMWTCPARRVMGQARAISPGPRLVAQAPPTTRGWA